MGKALQRSSQPGVVLVQGRALPVSKQALVLAAKQNSVFALADPATLERAGRPGSRVVMTGSFRRLDKAQAGELEKAVGKLDDRAPEAAKRRERVLRASRRAGDPYLAVQRIDPAPKGQDKGG